MDRVELKFNYISSQAKIDLRNSKNITIIEKQIYFDRISRADEYCVKQGNQMFIVV